MLQPGHHGVIVFAAGVQLTWTFELFQRRFDDVLELVIVTAVANLVIVELRHLVAGDIEFRKRLRGERQRPFLEVHQDSPRSGLAGQFFSRELRPYRELIQVCQHSRHFIPLF